MAKLGGSSSTEAIVKQIQDHSDAWEKRGRHLGVHGYVMDITESALSPLKQYCGGRRKQSLLDKHSSCWMLLS